MVCDNGVRQSGHCMEAVDGVPGAAAGSTLSHHGKGPAHCPICKAFVSPGQPCKRCMHLNRAQRTSTRDAVQAGYELGFDDPLDNPVAERIYSRYASVVTREDRRVQLRPGGGFSTDLQGRINVDPYPLGSDAPVEDQMIATWGGIEHELAHEKWSPRGILHAAARIGRGETDRKYSGFSGSDLSEGARMHVKEWLNVIEDGRIERLLQEKVPGAFKRVRAQDMLQPRWDERVGKQMPVYYEVIGASLYEALPNYAVQRHTYKAMSPEARKLFDRIRPIVQKGVTGDAAGALKAATEVVKILDEADVFEQPQNLPTTIKIAPYTGSMDADGGATPSGNVVLVPVNASPPPPEELSGDDESDEDGRGGGQSAPQHCPRCGAFVDKNGRCTNCDWEAPMATNAQSGQGSGGRSAGADGEDEASDGQGDGDADGDEGADEHGRQGAGDGADEDSHGQQGEGSAAGAADAQEETGASSSGDGDGNGGADGDADEHSGQGESAGAESSDGAGSEGDGADAGADAGGRSDQEAAGSDQAGGEGQGGGAPQSQQGSEQSSDFTDDTEDEGGEDLENLEDFPEYDGEEQEEVQNEARDVLDDLRDEAARTYANAVRDYAEETARQDAQKIHDGSSSTVDVQFAEGSRARLRVRDGTKYAPNDIMLDQVRDFRQTYAGAARRFSRELQAIKSEVQADKPFQRRGRFDRRRMKAAVKGDDRVYYKRGVDLDQDIAVAIQVDRSGSMHGAIREAVKAATITTMALEQCDIPYEVRSFHGSGKSGKQVLHKDFASPKATDEDLAEMLHTSGSTPMKRAVEITRASLSVREEGIKLAFILADGGPNGYCNDSDGDGYGYETPVRKAFEAMEEKGVTPVLVFTSPRELDPFARDMLDRVAGRDRWVHVRSPASLHRIVSDRIRDIFRNAQRGK